MDDLMAIRPEYVGMKEACFRYGFKKTYGYELLNKGEFRARRAGGKTLIEVASLEEWISRQPAYVPRKAVG